MVTYSWYSPTPFAVSRLPMSTFHLLSFMNDMQSVKGMLVTVLDCDWFRHGKCSVSNFFLKFQSNQIKLLVWSQIRLWLDWERPIRVRVRKEFIWLWIYLHSVVYGYRLEKYKEKSAWKANYKSKRMRHALNICKIKVLLLYYWKF